MKLLTLITAAKLLSFISAQEHGEQYAQSMGPVAFLWPDDRPWADDVDNTAPCGSSQGPKNRTTFPISGGHIALVAQAEAWAVDVRVSVSSDPTSQNDFQKWFSKNITAELDTAHTCYQVPDAPSSVSNGTNATIQLEYNAIDGTQNISHFVCADIIYVDADVWVATGYGSLCFNTTEGEMGTDYSNENTTSESGSETSTSASDSTATASASSSETAAASGTVSGSASSAETSNAATKNIALSGVLGLFGVAFALI